MTAVLLRRALLSAPVFVIALMAVGCGGEQDADAPSDEHPTEVRPEGRSPSDTASERVGTEVDRLQETLMSGSPQERVGAAFQAVTMSDIPAVERTDMLVSALNRELHEPSAEGAPSKTYLSTTDWIRAEFTRALGQLAREASRSVEDIAARESGETRDRLIVARGYAGDRAAVAELRRVLLESEHGDVRTDAAYVLGELGDTVAIPELIQALDDPHLVSYEDHGKTVSFYSVRVHAATALEKMGVEFRQREDGSYEVLSRRLRAN
jgi:hypothetical protein